MLIDVYRHTVYCLYDHSFAAVLFFLAVYCE